VIPGWGIVKSGEGGFNGQMHGVISRVDTVKSREGVDISRSTAIFARSMALLGRKTAILARWVTMGRIVRQVFAEKADGFKTMTLLSVM